ncbi:MAG: hypothetical protein ACI4TX_01935, partial [Christensenellales bacterium]
KFYSEMLFTYKNKNYCVFFYLNVKEWKTVDDIEDPVEFFEVNVDKSLQRYDSVKEFAIKANINGVPLKALCENVTFAGFMFCG